MKYAIINTATGEVIREWNVRRDRFPRRQTKRVRRQMQENLTIASGVVVGIWLSFTLFP
ncbi:MULTISPECIES: hypothetical protein [Streptomyces]|uniref:hypothetical protein n=1 Tax=Streptomyces TaxID=1883 RepID=UPI000A56A57D|nr:MULTISPECIES: hypothetical protein [Streptomyces]MDX3840062.1 hypothetical protein [Streptomyces europaeiscabiei]